MKNDKPKALANKLLQKDYINRLVDCMKKKESNSKLKDASDFSNFIGLNEYNWPNSAVAMVLL